MTCFQRFRCDVCGREQNEPLEGWHVLALRTGPKMVYHDDFCMECAGRFILVYEQFKKFFDHIGPTDITEEIAKGLTEAIRAGCDTPDVET
jgi:hypothetical protein